MTTPGTTPGEACPCCLQAQEDIKAAVAEALADPLAQLEALAKDEYCAILRTGGEESFTVSVYSEPDMTKGGFHYWIAEPGEDEATEVPRTEALALLKGGDDEQG